MSETNKGIKNAAIACGDMKADEKGIIVEHGNYGPSKNEINNLAGMEIKVEGYEIILDEKTGKLLRVKDNHTISEVEDEKIQRRLKKAIKNKEGIEH